MNGVRGLVRNRSGITSNNCNLTTVGPAFLLSQLRINMVSACPGTPAVATFIH